jgi:hypothetical protein
LLILEFYLHNGIPRVQHAHPPDNLFRDVYDVLESGRLAEVVCPDEGGRPGNLKNSISIGVNSHIMNGVLGLGKPEWLLKI